MNSIIYKPIQFIIDLIYPAFKKLMPYNVYSYLAVGGMNTALNIAIFSFLFKIVLPKQGIFFGNFQVSSPNIALFVAFLITVPTGFWLTQNFAFAHAKGDKKENSKQGFKYFLVVLQGLASDALLLNILISFLHFSPILAKVFSTLIVLTLNYLLQKHFTFKKAQ